MLFRSKKQKRFAEAIALEDMTGADAYRAAYNVTGKTKTIGDSASRLKRDPRISAEITALEEAKAVSAWHSAEALRSLVISTLTSAIIDPDTKPATKITAAKILGTVTEVAAFTERKEVTHIKDSGAIRAQILDQLKSLMLNTNDAIDVDANELLAELTDAEPHPGGTPPNTKRDSDARVHSIPHEQSQDISDPPKKSRKRSAGKSKEPTPISLETPNPGGDIFSGKDDAASQ